MAGQGDAIAKAGTAFGLPLTGVRVVDVVTGPMGAVGRFLVELGADVIRIEPPGGARDRRQGRKVAGCSLDFAAANLGKRCYELDLAGSDDRQRLESLMAEADVLLVGADPGRAFTGTLDLEAILHRRPGLVILSITDFGRSGPYRYWQATDPVFHALSGLLARTGLPGRAPLLPPDGLAYGAATSQAVFVLLAAYYRRLRSGLGDLLDFSILDGCTQTLDPGFGMAGSAMAGVLQAKFPRGRPNASFYYPTFACSDGYVRLCVLAARQWRGLFDWMGRPEAFADPSYERLKTRHASRTLHPAIGAFFSQKTCAEIEAGGVRHGVPIARVLDLQATIESDHLRARDILKTIEVAPGLAATFVDGILEFDGRRAGIRGGVPPLEARPATWWPHPKPVPDGQVDARAPDDLALVGLRVLDLGVIVAGAEQGRLLADQGADVIKIESSAFPDGGRQTGANGKMSPSFAAGHRNKRAMGINLRDPAGQALFRRMVAQADVLLSNFKAGTLDSLNLTYDALREVNPNIVVLDSSAFGASGPWSSRLGYGPLVRASAGMTAMWRYPDDPVGFSDGMTAYPDHVAGRMGAIGVLALLIRRVRIGRGGSVSLSQMEIALSHMATEIAALSLASEGHQIEGGNGEGAQWGVFPCAGDDEWCVVTVRDDDDWKALCRTIGRPELAGDQALATAPGRRAQRHRIDAAVCEWLAQRSPHDAMHTLQAGGVPAGAMLRLSELPGFDYFQQRAFFRREQHPDIDEPLVFEGAPVRSKRSNEPPRRPAPHVAEHTLEVVGELGLSSAEIAAALASGVIEARSTPQPQAVADVS